jgi:choline dehydrogenase-like flavoprotein
LVGDDRWSYAGLLPYFKRTEHHFDPDADASQHGFDGPIHLSSVSSSGRRYPLRQTALAAWSSLGLKPVSDGNNGHPQGISELVSNFRDGKRQLSCDVYPLDGVKVLKDCLVKRVTLDEKSLTATGIELADGRRFQVHSDGEVIVASGALRTPQVLQLSGIGRPDQLSDQGITPLLDLPVGENFHDHLMLFRYWKLRHPERGLAMGSALFNGPNYEKGGPSDWVVTTTVPASGYRAALAQDGHADTAPAGRSHLELNIIYAAFGGDTIGLQIPMDGTAIMNFYMNCLPTSRGSVSLASADPTASPRINPNFLATEADRYVMREGWRTLSRLAFETPEGRDLIAEEIVPSEHSALPSDAPDDQIDARVAAGGLTTSHPAGTASMGQVVDSSLKVIGVQNLRVVDASIVSRCSFHASLLSPLMICPHSALRSPSLWPPTIKLPSMPLPNRQSIYSWQSMRLGNDVPARKVSLLQFSAAGMS